MVSSKYIYNVTEETTNPPPPIRASHPLLAQDAPTLLTILQFPPPLHPLLKVCRPFSLDRDRTPPPPRHPAPSTPLLAQDADPSRVTRLQISPHPLPALLRPLHPPPVRRLADYNSYCPIQQRRQQLHLVTSQSSPTP